MAPEEVVAEDTPTKPTKAIAGFVGAVATGIITAAVDGQVTPIEVVVAVCLGAIAGATVYGFKNPPKE